MLFRRATLEGIARGEVTLAFRRWKKPTVKSGSRLRTEAGEVSIGAVAAIDETAVDAEAARRAGFATLEALRRELRTGEDRTLYRIEIVGIEPDRRLALREETDLGAAERAAIAARVARWDEAVGRPGYHGEILTLIAEQPGVAAATLARILQVEKVKFKRDVRKLKEIGLTESLEVGYRLSARARAYMGGDATDRPLAGRRHSPTSDS